MYCVQCGSKIDDDDKFCKECGKKVEKLDKSISANSNSSIPKKNNCNTKNNKKRYKFIFIFIANVFILLLIFLFVSNKNDDNNNLPAYSSESNDVNENNEANEVIASNSNTPTTNSSNSTSSDTSCLGDSQVKIETKDGRNYYTSSDGNWTVEERNISALINDQKETFHINVQDVTFDGVPAWKAGLNCNDNILINFNMIPSITPGVTYSLNDAGSISNGYVLAIYYEDKSMVDSSNIFLMQYYNVSTAYSNEDVTEYKKLFDDVEFRVDCIDYQKGIICAYASFTTAYPDKTPFEFKGYFAAPIPTQTQSENTENNNIYSEIIIPYDSNDNSSEYYQYEQPRTYCVSCHGSKMCQICNGTGQCSMYGNDLSTCTSCQGSGICPICSGTGYN